jgi:hypothetical protein
MTLPIYMDLDSEYQTDNYRGNDVVKERYGFV